MRRIYHHYLNWEDYQAGMWRNIPRTEEPTMLQKAVEFTGDYLLYGSFMQRVVMEWPLSCEHNLTDPSLNKRAWVGHAATCLAIQCPEHITRKAWRLLSQDQQDLANHQADLAIASWFTLQEKQLRLPI